jgi:beta-galactosidase
VAATTVIETTGAPAKLVLTTDRKSINADGEDVAVINVSAVDAQGREVPTADNLVKFEITGAKIIGVGNGDSSCHESDKGNERSLFNGLAQVIIQTKIPGQIKLAANADGLQSATLTLSSKAVKLRAVLP